MSKGTAGFRAHLISLLLFVGFVVATLVYQFSQAGTLPTLGKTYTVNAIVPTASTLTPGARVTVAGAEVGSLKRVDRVGARSGNARLELELTDDRVFPLPRDSRVQVRTRTQVGERYVAIVVGRDRATIPDGGTIELAAADPVVDVDEILSVLQGRTRERARTMLRQFGSALTGRGQELNRTLSGVSRLVTSGVQTVDVLSRRRETVAQLVDQLGRVTAAVGERGQAIARIGRSGVISLRALGERDAQLAQTLRELPATLDQVRATSRTVGDVSDVAAPVVSQLATATGRLQPAIANLSVAANGARQAVALVSRRRAHDVFRVIDGARQLKGTFTQAGAPLRSALCELTPLLRSMQPYRHDFLQILFHLSSSSHAYDATGHTVRLAPLMNENSLSGTPPAVLAGSRLLLQSGLFTGTVKKINYDPFIKPGRIGTTTSLTSGGSVSGPESLRESGWRYPRVKADC